MKLTKIQQIIAGVVIVVLTIVVSQMVILKSDRGRIQSTQVKIDELKSNISIAQRIQKAAAELEDEMTHLRAQLDRLKKILPDIINQPKFLADMKRYANENGIEIIALTNTRPVATDAIVEHPFGFQARGNYHDLGAFFAQLTNYQRIINVKGLNLERQPLSKDYSVKTWFMLSIFTYREPSREELLQEVEEARDAIKGVGKKGAKRGRKR